MAFAETTKFSCFSVGSVERFIHKLEIAAKAAVLSSRKQKRRTRYNDVRVEREYSSPIVKIYIGEMLLYIVINMTGEIFTVNAKGGRWRIGSACGTLGTVDEWDWTEFPPERKEG